MTGPRATLHLPKGYLYRRLQMSQHDPKKHHQPGQSQQPGHPPGGAPDQPDSSSSTGKPDRPIPPQEPEQNLPGQERPPPKP